jgi:type VI secretion system protein ImpM
MDKFSLGCFGKLPIHADFIQYNADGSEVRGLDQWFQEGIHLVKTRFNQGWAQDFLGGGTWNFVFQPKNGDRFLVGTYLPSQDKGGRQYPFFLFLQIDWKRFSVPTYFIAVLFSAFLDKSREVIQTGWMEKDPKGFFSLAEERLLPVEPKGESFEKAYREWLEKESTRHFWTNLLGDFGHPKKYRVAQNLIELLQPLRQQALDRFGLGIKFPLIPGDQYDNYDIALWFELMNRVLRQENQPPAYFWNRKSNKAEPGMVTFLRRPTAKNLLFLIRPSVTDDSLYDLASEHSGAEEQAIREIPENRRSLLDQGDVSLSMFLEKVGEID